MGHIINPISQRIGYSNFWNSNWALASSSNSFSYNYISVEDINLNNYLKKLFLYAGRRLFGKGLVFLGFKLLRFNSQIVLLIDVKLKQLINLYNSVELIFLNALGLNTAFLKQQVVYKSRLSIADTRKKNINRIFNRSTLTYKIKPKFLRRTAKLTPYNSVITEPDFWSYHWAAMSQAFFFKHKFRKNNKFSLKLEGSNFRKNIVNSTINYLLVLRWLMTIKKFIGTSLQRFYGKQQQFDIITSLLSTSALSASFISKYLSTRLLQKFPLRRLINLLVKQLKIAYDSGAIHGFKIACNGRFERRGRATHTWKLLGKNPRSDVSLQVDYSIMLPVLTNSICAVKVWLTKKNQNEKLLIL